MKHFCDCIDYPCSDLFQEFHEKLEGEHSPPLATPVADTSESYFESPEIIAVLEAMGIIRNYDKKLKGGIRL